MRLTAFAALAFVAVFEPAADADVPLDDFSIPVHFYAPNGPPVHESRPVVVGGRPAIRSESLVVTGTLVRGEGAGVSVHYGRCVFGYWESLNVPWAGVGAVTAADANPFVPLLDLSGETMIEVDLDVSPYGSVTMRIWDATLSVSDETSVVGLPTGRSTLAIDPATGFSGAVDLAAIGGIELTVTGAFTTTLTRFEATGGAGTSFPSFCDAADGSLASCPCANPGNPDTGCDIHQGTGGVRMDIMAQETSPSNRATATGSGFPAASAPAAIVIRSANMEASAVPFGDGLRCVGAPLVRLAATVASGGSSTHTFGHGAMAGTGDFHYQLWFRNTPAMFCTPDAFNLSNGRTLSW